MKTIITIICTIFMWINLALPAAAGELPTVSVFSKVGHELLIDADTATYEAKFGLWTFFDEVGGKTVEAKADDIIVVNMNGEYVVRDGHVLHRNSSTRKEFRLTSDAFGETLITTSDDNFVVNNNL